MYLQHGSVTATGVLFLLRRHLLKTTLNNDYLVSVERYLRKNLIDTSERSVVLWTIRDHGMKILHSIFMSYVFYVTRENDITNNHKSSGIQKYIELYPFSIWIIMFVIINLSDTIIFIRINYLFHINRLP